MAFVMRTVPCVGALMAKISTRGDVGCDRNARPQGDFVLGRFGSATFYSRLNLPVGL